MKRANDLRVLAKGQPIASEEGTLEPDGKPVHLSMWSPPADGDGRVCGIGGIASDVTERKRADDLPEGQIEELQRWLDVVSGHEGRLQDFFTLSAIDDTVSAS